MSDSQSKPHDAPAEVIRLEERQLLDRHQDGDPDAFSELVSRFRAPVYSYLVRCGVDETTRDDLFQEAFVKIHRSSDRYRPERPLGPWVFTIVANTVRSHFRARQTRDATARDHAAQVLEETTPDSLDLVEARETVAWIEAALRQLPLPQREAVILCCVQELPQADAAAALGVPLNTVKTHVRRGRIALAQALARRNARMRNEVTS